MINKKGYFFTLDAIVALTILAIGIVYVFLTTSYSSIEEIPLSQSQELMNFLTTTRVNEVNNPYLDWLRSSGKNINASNTLMEQIILLGNEELAQNLTRNLSHSMIPKQFGVEIKVDCITDEETILYNRTRSKNDSKILIPSRKLIMAQENKFTIKPCSAEVQVWQ